eukprot:s886_g7.t3
MRVMPREELGQPRPCARRCSSRPFRPLGYGNGKKESTTFSGWSNCYLGSNDPYGETLHSILSLVRAKYVSIDRFVSVVGSFVALQFLLVLKPKTMHFFDMNPQQVQWAKMLCELIKISKTPQEYISRVFARQVRPFERRLGHGGPTGDRLTHLNQHRFLRLPIAQRLRSDTLQRLSASAQETYQRVLVPLQEGDQPGWFTPTLLPCEDRRRLRSLARTGLGPQGRLPGDRCASLLYGEGWLSSQETFNVVKQKLATTSITWTSDVDFTSASPADIIPEDVPAARSLLFAMDMWSSHFARPLSKQLTLQWRGAGRLVVVQSITAQKSELVEELVGSEDLSWKSFSDWLLGDPAGLRWYLMELGDPGLILGRSSHYFRTTAKLTSEPEVLGAPESPKWLRTLIEPPNTIPTWPARKRWRWQRFFGEEIIQWPVVFQ